jgi:GST-like protein
MIDLYTWSTPNGRKVSIALEELELPYTVHAVNISKDEQFAPEFLKHSPNNKIPALHDQETELSLMESGAILVYLAEQTGKLLPTSGAARAKVLEWLMWQMGGLGPICGQGHHFLKYNPGKSAYAEQRFGAEIQRLYGVLDRQLAENAYLAGAQYSIADIASWPWVARFEWHQADLHSFPNVKRWYLELAKRPAVQRGYDVPASGQAIPLPS